MISLHSISGKEFFLNSELIYKLEREYDTIITLTDQKILRVTETPEQIVEKVIQFKNKVHFQPLEVESE